MNTLVASFASHRRAKARRLARLGVVAVTLAFLPALVSAQVPAQPSVPAPVAVQPAPATDATTRPQPPARWTPAQIRQSFELADSDSNGELTRAEAQRLTILPRSFEDADSNKDGVIAPGEYQASFSR